MLKKNPNMKQAFLIIVMTVTLGLSYFIFNMYDFAHGVRQDTLKNAKWQQENTAIYYIDLPEGLDTLDFKASIILDRTKNIHKIQFSTGGTGTSILIYDSTFISKVHNKIKMEPLISGDFKLGQKALLDISNLTQEKYYVHYVSCNLGGLFPLIIK